ncbi:MAG: right-handed parallel beta-helix repeat-containing protein [Acidobacteriaceae bacterium]|nr:right-handed parallel beta-helix repeat-containing protein [Acidobacteriaceae bacterium]
MKLLFRILCISFPMLVRCFGQEAMPDDHLFLVRAFGARGDATTLDTQAIQRAIEAAHNSGGGRVLFTPGTYVSGTLRLLDNVTLEMQAGAVLQGSRNVLDYGEIAEFGFGRRYGLDSSGEGVRVGLIVATGAKNIGIAGQGRIDGNGDSFFDLKSLHNTLDFDAKYTRQSDQFDAPRYGTEFGPVEVHATGRPGTMIILSECRNILIRDVTLSNAPNWTLHLQASENATISGIHIDNDVLLPNNDGIDCMRCKSIQVSDCSIKAGDDDLAIVSSDDVHVSNCSLFSYSAAVRLEDSRYSTFTDLSIHTNRGLAIFSRGDEHTAHILFSNITMETKLITGHWWGKAEPIYIAARTGSGRAEIRDVRFTNLSIEAESGIVLYGAPDSIIRDITLDSVRMQLRAPEQRIADSVGGNFDLRWTATNLSEGIFKHDIPGIYTRYVDGLRIRDFDLVWGKNLPAYFATPMQTEDSTHINTVDFTVNGNSTGFTTGN